jgi:hypothetical protein
VTRLWLLTAALLALALVACGTAGPDCVRYCTKIDDCSRERQPPVEPGPDFLRSCLKDCSEGGGERRAVIECIIDTSCTEVLGGHCSPTGQPLQ